MTDYKATPEQWEVQEKFAPESEDACCLLELRARVEILEACMYQFRCDHLRLANTCASMAPDRSKFFADLMLDEELRTACRPNPPSLKEQALGAMGRFTTNAHTSGNEMMRDFDTIRRALEELP
jgi:hypothetical protein